MSDGTADLYLGPALRENGEDFARTLGMSFSGYVRALLRAGPRILAIHAALETPVQVVRDEAGRILQEELTKERKAAPIRIATREYPENRL